MRIARRTKAIAALVGLAGFVGWFGVWHFGREMAAAYGTGWGVALGLMALAGLLVIVAVGITLIRNMLPEEAARNDERRGG